MRVFVRTLWFGVAGLLVTAGARADFFRQTNLVSNQPGVAPVQDANLVNPWGVSSTPTGPFWVSNNGSGTSTLYSVDSANVPTKLGLTVVVPGNGSVTGQVNTAGGLSNPFNGDLFLFVSEDGTVSGWRGALGSNAEVLQTGLTGNIYKGAAFANVGGHSYLYAANFGTGAVDVVKGDSGAPGLAGTFTDPGLPSGFAPFNVQNLGGVLYVTYAKQGVGIDEQVGAGLGLVSKFDLNGNFLGRVATQGVLNAPWGLAIAPAGFGAFAGDLLVGNFGDGRIHAYNLATNTLDGTLAGSSGDPLVIDGLWALTPGNGGAGGSPAALYFTAGPGGERNGLFGVITSVPEPSSAALLATALVVGLGVALRRRLSPPVGARTADRP